MKTQWIRLAAMGVAITVACCQSASAQCKNGVCRANNRGVRIDAAVTQVGCGCSAAPACGAPSCGCQANTCAPSCCATPCCGSSCCSSSCGSSCCNPCGCCTSLLQQLFGRPSNRRHSCCGSSCSCGCATCGCATCTTGCATGCAGCVGAAPSGCGCGGVIISNPGVPGGFGPAPVPPHNDVPMAPMENVPPPTKEKSSPALPKKNADDVPPPVKEKTASFEEVEEFATPLPPEVQTIRGNGQGPVRTSVLRNASSPSRR